MAGFEPATSCSQNRSAPTALHLGIGGCCTVRSASSPLTRIRAGTNPAKAFLFSSIIGRGTPTGDRCPRLTCLAGVAGFEPANAGVKILCLAAWRYPHDWWTVGCPAAHWHLFRLRLAVPILLPICGWRNRRDSNPRALSRLTVFKTVPFTHLGTVPNRFTIDQKDDHTVQTAGCICYPALRIGAGRGSAF